MSFARFGADSDVYVFEDLRGGFTCCSCTLAGDDVNVPTPAEMLAHLGEHLREGHDVPPRCVEELERLALGGSR